jgi:glutathione S-transferase
MFRAFDVATSVLATALTFGGGFSVGGAAKKPDKLLELYEFEACPFCRRVREVLTNLDLGASIFPCPRGGTRFRPMVERLGRKAQFPFLVDPNTGRQMFESKEIASYLYATYGDGRAAPSFGALGTAMSSLASGIRAKGRRADPSLVPLKLIELWSFEGSPFCRIVREELCSLELPYVLHNVGRGSEERRSFQARSGKMMVPYLADANTGREMFESAEILRYLRETYAA